MTAREEFEAWLNGGGRPISDPFDVWQASRTSALEEAAKECEQMQKHFDTQDAIDAAEQCAMAIRALKD